MEDIEVRESTPLDERAQENYSVWKKNTPFLYDYVSTNSLLWPALSIQFFPDLELHQKKTTPPVAFEKQDAEPDVFHQRLLLGTFTLGQAVDSVSIVQLPYYRDLNKHLNVDKLNYNADKEEFECTTVPKKKLTVLQKINHAGDVNKVRYMPQNPDVIASGNNYGDVVVYDRTKHSSYKSSVLGDDIDLNKPQLRLSTLGEDQTDIFALDWNKQKEGVIVVGSMNGDIGLYDIQAPNLDENKPLHAQHTFSPHKVGINDVQWTPDHDSVFTAVSDNGYITMFDVRAGENPVINRKAGEQAINCLSINNTSSIYLATGDNAGLTTIWDVRNLKSETPALYSLQIHTDSTTQIKWHPKYHNVLGTSSADRSVKLIDVEKFSDSHTPLFVHGGHMLGVNDFDWSLHEDWMVASVADDNSLHFWRPAHDIVRGYT